MSYPLAFTGERYLPWLVGNDPFIGYEHIHRYLLACAYVKDKRVLDIACGEGYGTAMLAQTARSVMGIDNDAATLTHAREHHGKPNVAFVQADAQQLSLPPDSLDVVVSFETIEHFQFHEQFLTAIRAALTDEGVLLISTPNRAVYNDTDQEDNPFHKRELYRDEFMQLLGQHFRHVQLFGQSIMANSMIAAVAGEYILRERKTCDVQITAIDDARIEYPVSVQSDLRPRYYLAVCSNKELGEIPDNLMVDNQSILLRSFVEHHRGWPRLLDENAHLQAIQVDTDRQVQTLIADMQEAQPAGEDTNRQAPTLIADVPEAQPAEEDTNRQAPTPSADAPEAHQTIAEHARFLDELRERIETLVVREGEVRAAFLFAHQQLLQRDEEILRLCATGEQLKQTVARKDRDVHTLTQQAGEHSRHWENQEKLIKEQLAHITRQDTHIGEQLAHITRQDTHIREQQRQSDHGT